MTEIVASGGDVDTGVPVAVTGGSAVKVIVGITVGVTAEVAIGAAGVAAI